MATAINLPRASCHTPLGKHLVGIHLHLTWFARVLWSPPNLAKSTAISLPPSESTCDEASAGVWPPEEVAVMATVIDLPLAPR